MRYSQHPGDDPEKRDNTPMTRIELIALLLLGVSRARLGRRRDLRLFVRDAACSNKGVAIRRGCGRNGKSRHTLSTHPGVLLNTLMHQT